MWSRAARYSGGRVNSPQMILWMFAVPIVVGAALLTRAAIRRRRDNDLRIPHEKIDISYRTGQFRR